MPSVHAVITVHSSPLDAAYRLVLFLFLFIHLFVFFFAGYKLHKKQ